MFPAACYEFVKEVGEETLIPAPSIDQKDNLNLLQLVVKTIKRKYFFFQSREYLQTDFKITDVLTSDASLEIAQEDKEVLDYNKKTKYSPSGKIGSRFAEEITDVKLEADRKIAVNIDFGKVMKKVVKIPDLRSKINKRNIRLGHNYIQQIRQDKRKVLCVITGVAYLEKGGTIHGETVGTANVSISGKILTYSNASLGAGIESDMKKNLKLAPGTPVAYSVRELDVDKTNGSIELVGQGETGGFKDIPLDRDDMAVSGAAKWLNFCQATEVVVTQPCKAPSRKCAAKRVKVSAAQKACKYKDIPANRVLARVTQKACKKKAKPVGKVISEDDDTQRLANKVIPDFQNPYKIFEPLMLLPEDYRREITTDLLCILDSPCDLPKLDDLLEQCVSKQCSPEGVELKLRAPVKIVQRILGHAGFEFKDGKAIPPKSENTILPCFVEFFCAATELDDDILDLITTCSQDGAVLLLTVLQKLVNGKTVKEAELIEQFTKNQESGQMKLLKEMRFRMEPDEIKAPTQLPYFIDEIYWVITALWGKAMKKSEHDFF